MLKWNKEYSNQKMAKWDEWDWLSHIFPAYTVIPKGGTLVGENVELGMLKGTVNV